MEKMIKKLTCFTVMTSLLAFFSLTAPLARAAEPSANIDGMKKAANVERAIKTAIDGASGAVTVIGSADITSNPGATVTLDIPGGVTVIWQASLTGKNDSEEADENPLMLVKGDGTFEVTGGCIRQSGNGSAAIRARGGVTISGGAEVIAEGEYGIAILPMAASRSTATP